MNQEIVKLPPQFGPLLMLLRQSEFVKIGPPSLSQVRCFRCNSAAVRVETIEAIDCMELFPSILLTGWTRIRCVDWVESKATD